jgi:hypothetical protein
MKTFAGAPRMIDDSGVQRFGSEVSQTAEEYLTSIAVAYRPPESHYIADIVCPVLDDDSIACPAFHRNCPCS